MSGGISDAAAALGSLGGKKGGRSKSAAKLAAARANLKKAQKALDADARRERARKAAAARWAGASTCTKTVRSAPLADG